MSDSCGPGGTLVISPSGASLDDIEDTACTTKREHAVKKLLDKVQAALDREAFVHLSMWHGSLIGRVESVVGGHAITGFYCADDEDAGAEEEFFTCVFVQNQHDAALVDCCITGEKGHANEVLGVVRFDETDGTINETCHRGCVLTSYLGSRSEQHMEAEESDAEMDMAEDTGAEAERCIDELLARVQAALGRGSTVFMEGNRMPNRRARVMGEVTRVVGRSIHGVAWHVDGTEFYCTFRGDNYGGTEISLAYASEVEAFASVGFFEDADGGDMQTPLGNLRIVSF